MSSVKTKTKKMAYVKVSYDSGSDGDIESEEEEPISKSPVKLKSPQVQKPRKKAKPSKVRKQVEKEKENNKTQDDNDDDIDDDDDDDDDDDSDSEDVGQDSNDDDETEKSGGGWADAMASILRKEAPEGSTAVLAKSKDFAKAKEQEKAEFMEKLKERQSKKKWENMAKAMPKVTEKEYERGLQRIATKGVVQLFNAVRKQQKTREEKLKEVGGSQRKRAKVEASLTKGDFLDMLKGTPAPSRSDGGTKDTDLDAVSSKKNSSADQPTWGVLRDDFMLGADMKDWDKANDESDDDDDDEDSGMSSDSD